MALVCIRSGHLHGVSPDGSRQTYIRQGCGSCDWCLKRRCRRWLKRIARTAETHRLTRLLTLTLDPAKLSDTGVVIVARHLRRTWAKFRTYLSRRYGTSLRYIAVTETGRRTTHLHLHILLGRYVPQPWISDVWDRLGGGRIVDVRYVDVQNVSRYLAKYVTKDSFPRSLLRRLRQFTASVRTWVDLKTAWSWVWDPASLEERRRWFSTSVSWEQTIEGVLVAFGVGG